MENIERTEQTVSASKKKKIRQEAAAQQQSARDEREKAAKQSDLLYRVVGIICAVAVVFLLIWNTGLIQRSATAVTVKDEKYSVGDMQYFFNTNKQSTLNYYYQNIGMLPFSTSTSTKSQVYNNETGESWYDYLLAMSVSNLQLYTAVLDAAEAEGFTLSQESKDYMDEQLKSLDTIATDAGYKDTTAYLRANYGTYMTYDRFVELYEANLVVSDYISAVTEKFTFDEEDFDKYYKENADDLDSYVVTQFVVRAALSSEEEELSDEEKKAAMEAAKEEGKALADEIYAKLESGVKAEKIAEEYEDKLYGHDIELVRLGSSLNSTYAEWAKNAERKSGDLTIAEYAGSSTAYYYYVTRFEDRYLNQTNTDDVRHILIAPEVSDGAKEATDQQKAAAKEKAEKLLDEFKAGKADEESFIALAKEHSDDTGSAAEGGLISGISADSSLVESFKEWAMSSKRTAGDTGIVESDYGYHIMYYVGEGMPVWKLTAQSALASEAYSNWEKELCKGYDAKPGLGMKFIQG